METLFNKLRWSWPWMARYPWWRSMELLSRMNRRSQPVHLIVVVANHFEPSWSPHGGCLSMKEQRSRLDSWHKEALITSRLVQDHDGTPFRHTPFFPAEQYDHGMLDVLAEMQAKGLGEVEIHLHHGIERHDTPENLRKVLTEFRDTLAERHKCLSRLGGEGQPRYGFVHGNLALANSAGGQACGVDEEMEILAETGCYADFTLPAVNHPAQVRKFNAIYQCGYPLHERAPHRSGPNLSVNGSDTLPIIVTGPIVLDWRRRPQRYHVPRIDDGVLSSHYPLDTYRVRLWRDANITVEGRPDWVFVKLYCHGFFAGDQEATIGEPVRRAWNEILEWAEQYQRFKIHFASARESVNIALAAVHGKQGNPHEYRDYCFKPILDSR